MADNASCIINHLKNALYLAFKTDQDSPPLGDGIDSVEAVKFFAGDGIPLAFFQSLTNGGEDCSPFIWVRLHNRYRTLNFPTPHVGPAPCGTGRAVKIEVGIARCAIIDPEPSDDDYATEAEIELDDSNRIDLALCAGLRAALKHECATATALDNVLPFGPEGGVIAWMGLGYAAL